MTVTKVAGRDLVPGESPIVKGSANFNKWMPVSQVDERDMKCADNWIPRHPDLIRLTGKHPFNSEPPHEEVMKQGWLTPVSMHFVRNHGAVPNLKWETHRIEITGLVNRPLSLSMNELVKLPAITLPCLITCCGNRRKEVNMVKNSQGFSWGPGAVSVNYWTGARLADVLKLAGVKSTAEGTQCVFHLTKLTRIIVCRVCVHFSASSIFFADPPGLISLRALHIQRDNVRSMQRKNVVKKICPFWEMMP
jgi:hypothetical protein